MASRRMPSGQGPNSRPRQSAGRRGDPARAAAARKRTPREASRSLPAAARPAANPRVEASRSATHPATARRAAAPGNATRTAARPPAWMSGRATALALVLLALILAYGYPLRLYLNQEAQIQRMEASQAAQRATIDKLADESAKYQDPAYIRALARARFQMVDAGVKGYIVLPAPVPPPSAAPGAAAKPTWYDSLWHSIRSADEPGGK